VLFDYGLVLSAPPDPASWQRMKDILHAGEPRFHAAYWRPRHDYDRGLLDGPGFWRNVAAELGHPLTANDLAALIEADTVLWTQPNQPMIDWAAALQRAGIRTGILSNLGDAMELGILDRCSWLKDFAHHTFSHRLRLAKPDAAIYRHAIEGLGVPADQILFIDDRAENIEGARAAGLRVLQYTGHDTFLRDLETGHFDGLPLPLAAV
jgi:putative hydrolase of the HAD superfamily